MTIRKIAPAVAVFALIAAAIPTVSYAQSQSDQPQAQEKPADGSAQPAEEKKQ